VAARHSVDDLVAKSAPPFKMHSTLCLLAIIFPSLQSFLLHVRPWAPLTLSERTEEAGDTQAEDGVQAIGRG